MNYWVQKGAPRHKLNVGLPLYGRSFTLSDASKSGINAPARDGGGTAGKYTREKGYLAYYEVSGWFPRCVRKFIHANILESSSVIPTNKRKYQSFLQSVFSSCTPLLTCRCATC